jgi:peptidoglycan hydrolase CwlO-like protein
MASDELRIILEDVKEKFDLVIEAVNMTNERMDRNEKAVEERFDRLDTEILLVKKDIREMKGDIQGMKGDIQGMKGDIQEMKGDIRDLRQDLNDHRFNTELHGSSKKVS